MSTDRGVWSRATLTLAITGGGALLSAVATVILTRQLGGSGYGAYAWAWAIAGGLAVTATLGLDAVVLRELSRVRPALRGGAQRLTSRIRRRVAAAAAGLAATVLAFATVAGGLLPEGTPGPLVAALPAVPLVALGAMDQAQAQALGRPAAAFLAWNIGRPVAVIVTVATAAWAMALDPLLASGLTTVAVGTAWAAARVTLGRLNEPAPAEGPGAFSPDPPDRRGLALLASAAVLPAYLSVTLLGVIESTSAAGLFALALQLSGPLTLIHAAIERPLSPVLARNGADLQPTLTRATRRDALATALCAVIVIVLAGPLVRLFGAEFAGAVLPLQILVAGHVINSIAAFNRAVLVMNGHGEVTARAMLVSLSVAVALLAMLVPMVGVEGAALAVLASVVVRNVLLSVAAWRLLNLSTTALTWRTSRGQRR